MLAAWLISAAVLALIFVAIDFAISSLHKRVTDLEKKVKRLQRQVKENK